MNKRRVSSLVCLSVILIVWELHSILNLECSSFIPPLSQIICELIEEILNLKLLRAMCISLYFVFVGYSISVVLSIVVSILCMRFKVFNIIFSTLYKVLNPLPSVAVLPVILLISGLNQSSIIILIFHSVFWPMLSSNMMGFSSVPSIFDDFANNISISPIIKYFLIFIPASFTHIITGMRTSWGRAWRSLISAEAIFGISGATQGLGYYIYYHRAFANLTNVFAGIIVICVISLIAEEIFIYLEKITINKWGMSK